MNANPYLRTKWHARTAYFLGWCAVYCTVIMGTIYILWGGWWNVVLMALNIWNTFKIFRNASQLQNVFKLQTMNFRAIRHIRVQWAIEARKNNEPGPPPFKIRIE